MVNKHNTLGWACVEETACNTMRWFRRHICRGTHTGTHVTGALKTLLNTVGTHLWRQHLVANVK